MKGKILAACVFLGVWAIAMMCCAPEGGGGNHHNNYISSPDYVIDGGTLDPGSGEVVYMDDSVTVIEWKCLPIAPKAVFDWAITFNKIGGEWVIVERPAGQ